MSVLNTLEEIKEFNAQIITLKRNVKSLLKDKSELPARERLEHYYTVISKDIKEKQTAKRIFIFCVLFENDRSVLVGYKQIKSGLRLLIKEVIGGSPSSVSHTVKDLFFEFKVYADFRILVEKYLTIFRIK